MTMAPESDGIIDNVAFAYKTVFGNWKQIWRIVLPLIIPLLIVYGIPAVFGTHKGQDPTFVQVMVSVFFYFLAVIVTSAFAIGWHRLVILGPSDENHVNLLNLQNSELKFAAATFGLTIFFILIVGICILIAGAAGPAGWLLGLILAFLGFAAFMRFAFYLPGTAVDTGITLREAFEMSKGLGLKLASCMFLTILPFMIFYMIVGFVFMLLAGVLTFAFAMIFPPLGLLMGALIMVPMMVTMNLMAAALGITLLSGYYMTALQRQENGPALAQAEAPVNPAPESAPPQMNEDTAEPEPEPKPEKKPSIEDGFPGLDKLDGDDD